MKRTHTRWIGVGLAAALATGAWGSARAVDLGSAVKLFGIGFAVQHFSGQINSFLNSVLAKRDLRIEDSTKVVPILSIGSGGYIGAAQVMGPPALVDRVKAVGQGEIGIGGLNAQIKGLFPIDTKDPSKGLHRVQGVGVSAVVDFKL